MTYYYNCVLYKLLLKLKKLGVIVIKLSTAIKIYDTDGVLICSIMDPTYCDCCNYINYCANNQSVQLTAERLIENIKWLNTIISFDYSIDCSDVYIVFKNAGEIREVMKRYNMYDISLVGKSIVISNGVRHKRFPYKYCDYCIDYHIGTPTLHCSLADPSEYNLKIVLDVL